MLLKEKFNITLIAGNDFNKWKEVKSILSEVNVSGTELPASQLRSCFALRL